MQIVQAILFDTDKKVLDIQDMTWTETDIREPSNEGTRLCAHEPDRDPMLGLFTQASCLVGQKQMFSGVEVWVVDE